MVIATMLAGQIAITGARRNDAQIPVKLELTCTLAGEGAPVRRIDVYLMGAIGSGAGVVVTLDREAAPGIELADNHDGIVLKSADDHTQNQIFNEFVLQVDHRRYLASLDIDYPASTPRPAIFDNSIAIRSARAKVEDLSRYRAVVVGGERLYVAKGRNIPVYLKGPCVLLPAADGSAY